MEKQILNVLSFLARGICVILLMYTINLGTIYLAKGSDAVEKQLNQTAWVLGLNDEPTKSAGQNTAGQNTAGKQAAKTPVLNTSSAEQNAVKAVSALINGDVPLAHQTILIDYQFRGRDFDETVGDIHRGFVKDLVAQSNFTTTFDDDETRKHIRIKSGGAVAHGNNIIVTVLTDSDYHSQDSIQVRMVKDDGVWKMSIRNFLEEAASRIS